MRRRLVGADRDEARRRVGERIGGPRKVEPTVEGRDDRDRRDSGEQQVRPLKMGVDDVELVRAIQDGPHRREDVRERVSGVVGGAKRQRDGRDVPPGHPGVAAREGRDLVAATDQFLHQLVDDPFGAPVAERRDAFERWSDLGDPKHGHGWAWGQATADGATRQAPRCAKNP